MLQSNINPQWKAVLADEWERPYFQTLTHAVSQAYDSHTIYPAPTNVFAAFNHCPFSDTKVVILGQDPYHGPEQANGLAFSVPKGIPLPPSLQNIYKEIRADVGTVPADGDLRRWAKQGVLLLNTTLTVEQSKPGSHQKIGWEHFTNRVISIISERKQNVVFLLWGAHARKKRELIDVHTHLVLEATHPSPLSAHRGFFGCKHFSQTNTYLEKNGHQPIMW